MMILPGSNILMCLCNLICVIRYDLIVCHHIKINCLQHVLVLLSVECVDLSLLIFTCIISSDNLYNYMVQVLCVCVCCACVFLYVCMYVCMFVCLFVL